MYDTLIIGAGLSGLAAGIRLAYYNQKVCILERHTTIGGLNSFYRLRNRNHDVGLHAVTNYADASTKRGPLRKLLRQLRMDWEDFSLCPQNGSRVSFPDCSLKFTNDFEVFRSEIHQAFPDQAESFDRLHAFVLEFDELNLKQRAVSARSTVAEFLSDPLLIDMIFCPLMFYGSARPNDMDLNQFVIMYKSIYCEGFGRPDRGVKAILKNLVRRYKELGGELRLRAGVSELVVEKNRLLGVILDDGSELECDQLLSSAGAAETAKLCPSESAWANHQPAAGEVSFNEIIHVLDKQPSGLKHDDTIIFYNNDHKFVYDQPQEPCDLVSGIICSPNNFQYEQQLEEGIIRLTALANHHYWLNLPEDDYQQAKIEWNSRMTEESLKFLPDYRPHIIDTDSFTPRTIKKFTGHINGCVYGAPDKLLDGMTPVQNLFLCGTDQGFLGIIGSMLSGITMANNHCLKSI